MESIQARYISFPENTIYLLLSGSTTVDSILIVDHSNLLEYHVCLHRCIYSPRLSSDWNKHMNLIMLADIAYLSTIGGSSLSVIFDLAQILLTYTPSTIFNPLLHTSYLCDPPYSDPHVYESLKLPPNSPSSSRLLPSCPPNSPSNLICNLNLHTQLVCPLPNQSGIFQKSSRYNH